MVLLVSERRRRLTPAIAVLALSLVGAGYLLVLAILYLAHAVQGQAVFTCRSTSTPPGGFAVVLACAGLFTAGGLLTRHRARGAGNDRDHPRHALAVRLALPIFVGTVAALLGYETLAYSRVEDLQPITAYVRCAVDHGTGRAVGVTAALAASFLIGQWTWRPPRGRS